MKVKIKVNFKLSLKIVRHFMDDMINVRENLLKIFVSNATNRLLS